MFVFNEYEGKELVDNIDDLANEIDDFDWLGDSGTYLVDYRPYDPESEGEEANWDLKLEVYFEVEDNIIINTDTGTYVYALGDSGLGDPDPDEEWTYEDYNKALSFFNRITK